MLLFRTGEEIQKQQWYKIQNTKYKIQNTKYKIQNTKYKIQNTKSINYINIYLEIFIYGQMPDPGCIK